MSMLFMMGDPGRQSRNRIERLRVRLEGAASAAEEAERERLEATQGRDRLRESHPEYYARAAALLPQVMMVVAGAVGIYVLDFLFLSPMTRFIVGDKWGRSSGIVIAALFTVPLGIMLLESLLSLARHRAQENATETLGGSMVLVWTCLALILGLVVPLGVVAAFMASHHDFPIVIWLPLLLALVTLAAAAHLLIIFGFSLLQESLSFVSVNMQSWWQSKKANASLADYRRHEQVVLAAWPRYIERIDQYNSSFPSSRKEIGPFSIRLQQLLRQVYGGGDGGQAGPGGNGSRPSRPDGDEPGEPVASRVGQDGLESVNADGVIDDGANWNPFGNWGN